MCPLMPLPPPQPASHSNTAAPTAHPDPNNRRLPTTRSLTEHGLSQLEPEHQAQAEAPAGAASSRRHRHQHTLPWRPLPAVERAPAPVWAGTWGQGSQARGS